MNTIVLALFTENMSDKRVVFFRTIISTEEAKCGTSALFVEGFIKNSLCTRYSHCKRLITKPPNPFASTSVSEQQATQADSACRCTRFPVPLANDMRVLARPAKGTREYVRFQDHTDRTLTFIY